MRRTILALCTTVALLGCVTEPQGDLTAEQQLELNRQRLEQQRLNQESTEQGLEAAEAALEIYDAIKQQQCRDDYWKDVERAVDACGPLPPWPCAGDGPVHISHDCET